MMRYSCALVVMLVLNLAVCSQGFRLKRTAGGPKHIAEPSLAQETAEEEATPEVEDMADDESFEEEQEVQEGSDEDDLEEEDSIGMPGGWREVTDQGFIASTWDKVLKEEANMQYLMENNLRGLGAPVSARVQVVAGANWDFVFSDGTKIFVHEPLPHTGNPIEIEGMADDESFEEEEEDDGDEESLEQAQEYGDGAEESSFMQEEDKEEASEDTENQDEDEGHEIEDDEQEEQDAEESSLAQEDVEEQTENGVVDQDVEEGDEVEEQVGEGEEEKEEQDTEEPSLVQEEVEKETQNIDADEIESSNAGKCTTKDQSSINKMGPGNSKGKWPRFVKDCTHDSVRTFPPKWLGHSGMVNCIRKKHVSKSCATCFADMSKFGFDNCKMACMSSWCSKGCLSCTRGNKAANSKLQKCTGMKKIPAPNQC